MRVRGFRAVRAALVAGSVVALAVVMFAPSAGAGLEGLDAPLTIVKVVNGVAPAGTTFTATIQCDDDIIDNGDEGSDVATVTFDATGQPTSADVIGFDGPGECEISETATGGASSVSYDCSGVQGTPDDETEPPLEDSGFDAPSSSAVVLPPVCAIVSPDGVEVNISAPDQSGTVTITNTFADPQPQPAAQIVAQPAFTG
jgi:hypothetical protein